MARYMIFKFSVGISIFLLSFCIPLRITDAKTNDHSKESSQEHPLKEMFDPDQKPSAPSHVSGEILVKIRKDDFKAKEILQRVGKSGSSASVGNMASEKSVLERKLEKYKVQSAQKTFPTIPGIASTNKKIASPDRKPYPKAAEREDLARWYRLKLPEDVDIDEFVNDIKQTGEVDVIEPVVEWRVAGFPDNTTDPGFNNQWHLSISKIPDTWRYLSSGGSSDVVVAIIDTGVDYTHEDLIGNMWSNPGEIADNELDDDGNGFVDDIHGCSVVSDGRTHSGNPMDQNGHGTHVSGIVAATAYNHRGGVGVAYNTRIMAIRAAQYSGVLAVDDIAEGIIYAVDNGADVINMSFGGKYQSQIVEDALAVAFSQAVLVAAAGNDLSPTEKKLNIKDTPFYPASYPWVLGVMASTPEGKLAWFTNYDPFPGTQYEYEVAAPGESIYSTVPGNGYAKWSGTSMAAPIVSGMAALMRSFYYERALYSSRFIMGQIAGTTTIRPKGSKPGEPAPTVDAHAAATKAPVPSITMVENWLFDGTDLDTANDGDGQIDSGEKIYLAIELKNIAGMADQVTVTLEALAGDVGTDPYVTMEIASLNFGQIGPFNTDDNDIQYDDEGAIVGVGQPFVFSVNSDCPNDHVIPFVITITWRNGWDLEDTKLYGCSQTFSYSVQKGYTLPSVISEDMILTPDKYYIVGGPVLIEEGVTLSAMPGTQVQWGAISDDPYNPGPQNGNIIVRGTLSFEGSYSSPISLFPSYLVSGQEVKINVETSGRANLKYVKVRNPSLTGGFNRIDHCYLDWDYGTPLVQAEEIGYTIFYKHLMYGTYNANLFETCLFSGCWSPPDSTGRLYNNVFLQDNDNGKSLQITPIRTIDKGYIENGCFPALYFDENSNTTYALLQFYDYNNLYTAEAIANYLGGHVASVSSSDEQSFMEAHMALGSYSILGMSFEGYPRQWIWLDGTPVTFTNWYTDYPKPYMGANQVCAFNFCYWSHDLPVRYYWRNAPEGGNTPFGWTFVLRLPGVHTTEDLNVVLKQKTLLDYIRANHRGFIRYNAFLNKYWDANVSKWIRIIAPNNSTAFVSLQDNFWGTVSQSLVNHMIIDYYDNFVTAKVDYGVLPVHGFTSTYPFAESILINGQSLHSVPEIPAGNATFTIHFNRAMNQSIEPFVTFGPLYPYTDYHVHLGGQWKDSQTWEATYWFTPMTGDGYHLVRVSGAVAADDPWLVSGYDVGRFRFKVHTMGVAAMTLQANGGEGCINLTWLQDDFDLLAGYYLYRSDNSEGPFERLNSTVIPVGQESYTDTGVEPAIPMYYKFTVVQTDMKESDFSNIASASAVDTIAPTLKHAPVTSSVSGVGLRLTAQATDNVGVDNVTIHYRLLGSTVEYGEISMVQIAGYEWSGTIPGSSILPPGIEYYITASDGISVVFYGTPSSPQMVSVSNIPAITSVTPNYGPITGGSQATLSGRLFQQDASVMFGDALATNVILINPNQLTCTIPPHYPTIVDVHVINPDETQCTLLNGFQYKDTGVVVSMPIASGDCGEIIELDIFISNVEGLLAVDGKIEFDPAVLRATDMRVGTLTPSWSLSKNINTTGTVIFSLANATPVTGNGSLVRITFEIVGFPPAGTELSITSLTLNDGAIESETSNGWFEVNGFFNIEGSVPYFGGGVLPGVLLTAEGPNKFIVTSDDSGNYRLNNLPTGSYNLTPSKMDDVNEITAYDASLALQSAAGLITLSEHQKTAADVNNNGTVTSMDASFILQKSVDLINVPFPGSGRIWAFDPEKRSYPLLNEDQLNQTFTGVLVGDVSGNWQTSGQCFSLDLPVKLSPPAGTAILSLQTISGQIKSHVFMPLYLDIKDATFHSANLTITYDQSVLNFEDIVLTDISEYMNKAVNATRAGVIKVGLAGTESVETNGIFLYVVFQLLPGARTDIPVQITSVELDEGAVPVMTESAVVQPLYEIADLEPDGDVDLNDFVIFAKAWSSATGDSSWNTYCDIAWPGNGQVDLIDLAVFCDAWLTGQ